MVKKIRKRITNAHAAILVTGLFSSKKNLSTINLFQKKVYSIFISPQIAQLIKRRRYKNHQKVVMYKPRKVMTQKAVRLMKK
ncbi:MAG: hypothetical protein AMK74_03790 [Nitrospira bacterium SM23_35]|nr:MAG: hypothetical protein AMK74_03790 [Nitrospira bacterium SM23_35]